MRIVGKLFLVFLAGLIVIAADTNKPAAKKVKDDARGVAEKTEDTVKDAVEVGKQKAKELATNASAEFKQGLHKAGEITTNAVEKIKEGAQKVGEVTTNVVGKVKEKAKEIRQ